MRVLRGSDKCMQIVPAKNITRYTYLKAAFQGWRVCISRQRMKFTRYFSDKVFGGEENSYAAAIALRNRILAELQARPDDVEGIFARYR